MPSLLAFVVTLWQGDVKNRNNYVRNLIQNLDENLSLLKPLKLMMNRMLRKDRSSTMFNEVNPGLYVAFVILIAEVIVFVVDYINVTLMKHLLK